MIAATDVVGYDELAVKLLVFLSDDDTELVLDLLEREGWTPPSNADSTEVEQ